MAVSSRRRVLTVMLHLQLLDSKYNVPISIYESCSIPMAVGTSGALQICFGSEEELLQRAEMWKTLPLVKHKHQKKKQV